MKENHYLRLQASPQQPHPRHTPVRRPYAVALRFRKDGGGCRERRSAGGLGRKTAAWARCQPTGCAESRLFGSRRAGAAWHHSRVNLHGLTTGVSLRGLAPSWTAPFPKPPKTFEAGDWRFCLPWEKPAVR
ncbi:hypothetical protein P7K49_012293 [Saguinus oedipus]|uniref:Uncharacterized protein n=1 Tax=Saguinus oedipus TaxID=9490 RepID=A0ABQ9VT26_SAGOE|nr:hypothetical protein P7K49_012293 [Saguinus oedipus]